MHILRLAPDYIKLDGELISSIDVDPVRRSLAASPMRSASAGATISPSDRDCRRTGRARGARRPPCTGLLPWPPRAPLEIAKLGRSGSARVRRQTRGTPRAKPRAARAGASRA